MSFGKFLFNTPVLGHIEKHLNRQVSRSQIISSNLANVETPGYKAKDIQFDTALSKASGKNDFQIESTSSRHFHDSEDGEVIVQTSSDSRSEKVDGNSVDLDTEMGKLATVQLMYEAGLTALARKLSMISKAADNKF